MIKIKCSQCGTVLKFPRKNIGILALFIFLILTVIGAIAIGTPEPLEVTKRSLNETQQKVSIDEWANAGLEARAGDAIVKIIQTDIGPIQYQQFGGIKFQSKDDFLKIKISIRNDSDVKKYSYISWGLYDFRNDLLSDEYGNFYKIHATETMNIVGQLKYEEIYPKQSVKDLLVFARPVAGAKQLRLFLPGIRITDDKPLRFKFPAPKVSQVEFAEY